MNVISVAHLMVIIVAFLTVSSMEAGDEADQDGDYRMETTPGVDSVLAEREPDHGTLILNVQALERKKRQAEEGLGLNLTMKQALLDRHNTLRQLAGASNIEKMAWDQTVEDELVDQMDGCPAYIDGISDGGTIFRFVPSANKESTLDTFQELTDYIASWFEEGAAYDIESNECDSNQRCAIYKQITRSTTDMVGCTFQICDSDTSFWETQRTFGFSMIDGAFLVFACGYRPSSSLEERPYVPGEPCMQCSADKQVCENNLCTSGPDPTAEPCRCENGGIVDTMTSCLPGDITCIPCICKCISPLHVGHRCEVAIDGAVAVISVQLSGEQGQTIGLVLGEVMKVVADVVNDYCELYPSQCCPHPMSSQTFSGDINENDIYVKTCNQVMSTYNIQVNVLFDLSLCSASTTQSSHVLLPGDVTRTALEWDRSRLEQYLIGCCVVDLVAIVQVEHSQLTSSEGCLFDDRRDDKRKFILSAVISSVLLLLIGIVVFIVMSCRRYRQPVYPVNAKPPYGRRFPRLYRRYQRWRLRWRFGYVFKTIQPQPRTPPLQLHDRGRMLWTWQSSNSWPAVS